MEENNGIVRKDTDYQIIIMNSNGYFLDSKEYIAYCRYVEERVPMNTVKECEGDYLSDFLRYKFIRLNLQDMDKKNNLNDYRVKVFCQPVLNIKTGTFSTAEALMRLDIPEVGMVYPDQFIGVAESENMIHTLSKIILNKTCQNIKLGADGHSRHLLGSRSDDLVDYGKRLIIPVTDRDWTAKEFSLKLYVDELTRRS